MTGRAPSTLRAISIRPPWSEAVAAGVKLIENRSRGAAGWKHRGPLLIVAGLTWSGRGATDARMRAWWWGDSVELRALPRPDLDRDCPYWHFGEAVALAELVDIHPGSGCCEPWGEDVYRAADGSMVNDVTHLVLEDVRRLETPVSCSGRLGLFTPPADVVAAVVEQLGEAA